MVVTQLGKFTSSNILQIQKLRYNTNKHFLYHIQTCDRNYIIILIINSSYNLSPNEMSEINSMNETNKINKKDEKDSYRFTNIISAFGSYCNELSLYWFQRLLYTQTFLSSVKPKYIFIFVHNFGNFSICTGYNKDILLYKLFTKYIERYFKNKIKIFIYFDDKLHSASYSRNFLSNKINDVFNNNNNNYSISKPIVVSFIDADDIPHPNKYEILDYIYSNMNINGTIIHQYRCRPCRQVSDIILDENNKFFKQEIYNIINDNKEILIMKPDIIYNKMNSFHNKQIIKWNKTINNIFKNINNFKNLNYNYFYKFNTSNYANVNPSSPYKMGIAYINNLSLINDEACCANGWPTTTLSALMTNPFHLELSSGEDHTFHNETKQSGFKIYNLYNILGIYCQGKLKFKAHKIEN